VAGLNRSRHRTAAHALLVDRVAACAAGELFRSGATRSRGCECHDAQDDADVTGCSASRLLPGPAFLATGRSEAPGTTYSSFLREWSSRREPERRLPASGWSGARSGDTVNSCEVPINAVNQNKPTGLTGLDQNGTWPGCGAPNSPPADDAPPAERHHLHPQYDHTRGTW
jgi:hypothetical protein